MDDAEFQVRFWGVRGSIACSSRDVLKYGGNTSSLEVRCGRRLLLLDAGTGIRYLGRDLQRRGVREADILLTHTHFDHVCGLPFFEPFFDAGNRYRIWAGHLLPAMTIERALVELMMAPLFPVPPSIFAAEVSFKDFRAGDRLALGDGIDVQTGHLNHPNKATGYRINYRGKSLCYLTDTEHVTGELDENILKLIKGADIVIYDSNYTDEEYPNHVGWGHSTWQQGVRLCDAAGVRTFVAFHHDPWHDDAFLDKVADELEAMRPGSVMAREGLVLKP